MQMEMNRLIPIPNKSNTLLHRTICIMKHITLPPEEKELKNVINRNENDNKKQSNILFQNHCIIEKISSLTNAAMQDGHQELYFLLQ